MPIPISRIGELVYVTMKALAKRGGDASARDLFADVAPELSLTEEELAPVSNGEPRWTNLIRWYSVDAVKTGYLTKENGHWRLTETGLAAVDLPQDQYFAKIREGYRAWDRNRKLKATSAAESEGTVAEEIPGDADLTTTATYQDATERAAQEIVQHIESLGPYEFQELVGEVMTAMGYHVRSIAPPGPDGGVDLVVYPDPLGTKNPRLIIQVKHRADKVTVKEMRELSGLLRANDDMGIFVSRGGFTPDAVREANMASKRIELMPLDRLLRLAVENYSKMPEKGRRLLPLTPVFFLTPPE